VCSGLVLYLLSMAAVLSDAISPTYVCGVFTIITCIFSLLNISIVSCHHFDTLLPTVLVLIVVLVVTSACQRSIN